MAITLLLKGKNNLGIILKADQVNDVVRHSEIDGPLQPYGTN
jgi:hypothetical protein